MNVNGQDEDGIERKEDKSVNSNSFAIGLHAAKLQRAAVSR